MERLGGSCACNDAYALWNCTTDKTEAVRCAAGKVEIDHCDKGCTTQPIGTNDVCNKSVPPGGGNGGGGVGAVAQLSGHPGGGSDDNGDKGDGPMAGGAQGGCSIGGDATTGGAWLFLLTLAMIVTRRGMARAS